MLLAESLTTRKALSSISFGTRVPAEAATPWTWKSKATRMHFASQNVRHLPAGEQGNRRDQGNRKCSSGGGNFPE